MSHAERKHALLSASDAHRWLACTLSPTLEEKYPDTTSVYAEEGTKAHELAEKILNGYLANKPYKPKKDEREMAVELDPYITHVTELVDGLRLTCKSVNVFLETRLDFSKYVPEGFGTGDVTILADETIYVIDLKYGKGLRVDAENNPQLRLYGLGAISAFDDLYEFEKVSMQIVQPRLDHISEEISTKEGLIIWGEDIKPIALKAWNGEGEAVPGEHCRFCKASVECRALAEMSLDIMDDSDIDTLSIDEIGDILTRLRTLENWIKNFKDHALNLALTGTTIPGHKIVEGRSVRKYKNEDEVAKTLIDNGYEEALLFEKRLYGITKMEKIVGKKSFNELLKDLIIKPQGAPTLVPNSDRRNEFIPDEILLKNMEIEEE
jgi:hypothetical protein